MRIVLVMVFVVLFAGVGGAQVGSAPKKTWTPKQIAAQQREREFNAKRGPLRAQAKAAFDAEMALEKAGDCKGAQSNYDFKMCFGKADEAADAHLKSYEEALDGILQLFIDYKDPDVPDVPHSGIAGVEQTPEQDLAEYRRLEAEWVVYEKTAGEAAVHQFDGGTGGPSAGAEMHLRLVRAHLRDLDFIYAMVLRL